MKTGLCHGYFTKIFKLLHKSKKSIYVGKKFFFYRDKALT